MSNSSNYSSTHSTYYTSYGSSYSTRNCPSYCANGCSNCGPGTYQDEFDYLGELCTNCPTGKYAQNEGQPVCDDCYKPECAKEVTYCNPISGLEQTFSYYDIFEAPNVPCGGTILGDACSAPSNCIAGAAQCSAEPQREGATSSQEARRRGGVAS